MSREHVVLKALLGNATAGSSSWPVVLLVHKSCEESNKRRHDHGINLLQKIHTTPSDKWPEEQNKSLGITSTTVKSPSGDNFPVFGNVQELLEAAWVWIRGLHAALYQNFLPDDCNGAPFPPVPARASNQGVGMDVNEDVSPQIIAVTREATDSDLWDGIDAWGGELTYRCAWHNSVKGGEPVIARFWVLIYPGVQEWSRSYLPEGQLRPWHGYYICENLHPQASVLPPDSVIMVFE